MRRVVCALALAFCVGAASAHAQDAKIKSETKIKADDAKVVSMTGCLEGGPSEFRLSHVALPKDQAKKVEKIVGTTGTVTSYQLSPQEGINLGEHIGQQVQVTGVMIPAASSHDKHTKIEVKEKSKVDVDHGPDQKVENKSKAEIAKGDQPTLNVVSVKQLGAACIG